MNVNRQVDEVQPFEQLLDGLSAHLRLEGVAVGFACLAEVLFGEKLLLLQLRRAWFAGIGDDVILEVDDLFPGWSASSCSSSVPSANGASPLKNQIWTTGAASSMWPMRLRRTRLCVTLTPQRSSDHALVLHAAILCRRAALPVRFGTEDAFAEKAVLFGAVGAVVDRFGLFHFAERPAADVVWAGEADANRAVVVDAIIIDVAGTSLPPP